MGKKKSFLDLEILQINANLGNIYFPFLRRAGAFHLCVKSSVARCLCKILGEKRQGDAASICLRGDLLLIFTQRRRDALYSLPPPSLKFRGSAGGRALVGRVFFFLFFFAARRVIWTYKSKSAFSSDKEDDKLAQSNRGPGKSCGLEAFKSSRGGVFNKP